MTTEYSQPHCGLIAINLEDGSACVDNIRQCVLLLHG